MIMIPSAHSSGLSNNPENRDTVNMWAEVLLYTCSGAFIFILFELISTAVRNKLAHQFFKRRSPKLPVLPSPGTFGGHMSEVVWTKRSWRKLQSLHEKYGNTFGLYHCHKPHVSTIDLDLIKAIVLDKSTDHLTPTKLDTPFDLIEKDSILTSSGEQWRRLRSSIAPGLT